MLKGTPRFIFDGWGGVMVSVPPRPVFGRQHHKLMAAAAIALARNGPWHSRASYTPSIYVHCGYPPGFLLKPTIHNRIPGKT